MLTEAQINEFIAFARELPQPPPGTPPHREAYDNAALICLDVPLSIRNNYRRTVQPRIRAFALEHPEIDSLAALKAMIDRIGYEAFGEVWNFRAVHRVQVVDALTQFFLDYKVHEGIDDDLEAIRHWCAHVDITSKTLIDVKGIGLSAAQQLRMVAGHPTIPPGAYLTRGVKAALGEMISDGEAILLVESAARRMSITPMDVGYGLWIEFEES